MLDLFATIRNVEFRGAGTSAFGFIVESEGFDGWEDGGTTSSSQSKIPLAHGDYDLPQYLDSRIIAFSGICKAPSREALAAYGRRFRGLAATGATGERLVVAYLGETAWASVKLAPGTTPKFKSDGGQADDGSWFARFAIQFKAADPRKYTRPEHEFPLPALTWVNAFHRGNFDAHGRIVVTGVGANGYWVYGPNSKMYRVSRPLVSPAPHTIDLRSGQLLVGGSPVVGGIVRADTWAVAPSIIAPTTPFNFDPNGNTASAVLFLPDTSI